MSRFVAPRVRLARLLLTFAALCALASPLARADETCLTCHFGIEEMHPWSKLSCTQCHGGDGAAETKEKAHVQPSRPWPNDERVLPQDFDLAYARFSNPSNLRVLDQTCGTCHRGACSDLLRSLHGTTAGHLNDGLYECGINPTRESRFGMFRVERDPSAEPEDEPAGEARALSSLARLLALPSFDPKAPRDRFASHYADLPAKNCVQCHLWSEGVALRGRLGHDGDYRAQGCAACHVPYADDGLSKSGDPTVDRLEPGHPLAHAMTSAIPTETCTRCHYGDASIGLSFRGLAQLHPGQPAGPQVMGTTPYRLNRTFYQQDPKVCPPDLHHEAGLACIDCHTARDVMGDGRVYGRMEDAVEIECQDCHGTIDEPSRLLTSRGNRLDHLAWEEGRVVLTSKVTGKKHVVKQAAHVVNPRHPDYLPRAAEAMTSHHGRLECYACHGGWSPNFFGFHFDRNEQFTQLDLMTGERTPGRVTTQEKTFSTFRGLYLGWNSEGRVAPYMVGFSSMGTIHDERGRTILDQVMPETAAGLSGMTMIHHQLHATRRDARECADCHRNPTALGLGSPNASFRLGRHFAYVASERGLDVLALDRRAPGASAPVATVPMFGARHVSLATDPLQAGATHAYVAVAGQGIVVVDLANPAFPQATPPRPGKGVVAADARASVVAGDRLYVAAGVDGVVVADLSDPGRPMPISSTRTSDARALQLNWPHLYVADFRDGLVVLDVTDPRAPTVVATSPANGDASLPSLAVDVALLSIPGRVDDGVALRTETRVLAGLACGPNGLEVVDVTEPRQPARLLGYGFAGGIGQGRARSIVKGVTASSKVDLGSADGGIPTEENDYFYVVYATENGAQARVMVVRATEPTKPKAMGETRIGDGANGACVVHVYNPPFLQQFVLVAGGGALDVVDVTRSKQPEGVARLLGLRGAVAVAVEGFPLDRLVDEAGRPWKDVSHEGARFFSRREIDTILRADVPVRRPVGPVTPSGGRRPRQAGADGASPK